MPGRGWLDATFDSSRSRWRRGGHHARSPAGGCVVGSDRRGLPIGELEDQREHVSSEVEHSHPSG
jgi:hypothetical protein